MPLVSVVLAFHRVTPFLRPAVQSVLRQTLADLELIVVDDGTGAGLAALGEDGQDPRVRLIGYPENRGIAAAHNAAVAAARGEFIALMDYDDVSLPQRLERQVAALRAEPGLGLVFTAADTIDGAGRVTGREFAITEPRDHAVYSAFAMPANSPTLTARREVFARFPHREDYRIAPDYDFFTRAVEAWPSRTLAEPLFQYRRHGAQTTAESYPRQVLENSITRLLTARRRAGRPEDYAALLRETAALHERPPAVADTHAWFGHRAAAEGLPVLAAYCARRVLAARRDVRGLNEARRILSRAWPAGRGRRGEMLRLFLTGPVRAHGLRPVGDPITRPGRPAASANA